MQNEHTQPQHSGKPEGHHQVKVNDDIVIVADRTPTGRQILNAASLRPVDDFALVQWLPSGELEEVGPDENAPLNGEQLPQFFAWPADRLFYFTLDGRKFPWDKEISESRLRELGRLPATHGIWIDKQNEADQEIAAGEVLDLSAPGVEHLYSKKRSWKLDVQGIVIESDVPQIVVRDAIQRVGLDPNRGWTIVLKVQGHPKEQLQLDSVVDLRTPGIERLRLLPGTINNGEAPVTLRRDFQLQPQDEAFLTSHGYQWETIALGRRWLIIRNYRVPAGYQQQTVDLAIDIPAMYPAAEIDMFYCHPALSLPNTQPIPQTEAYENIGSASFQRWSRHRVPGTWNPSSDSVVTHLALVEESLLREVGQ
ncbi:MAG: multiubiquitin domain-containing protein [Pseudomonadales bacterium]